MQGMGCDGPVSLAHFLALEKDKAFVGLYVCKLIVSQSLLIS